MRINSQIILSAVTCIICIAGLSKIDTKKARLYRSSNFNRLSETRLAKAYITWLLHTQPIHKRSVATSITTPVFYMRQQITDLWQKAGVKLREMVERSEQSQFADNRDFLGVSIVQTFLLKHFTFS